MVTSTIISHLENARETYSDAQFVFQDVTGSIRVLHLNIFKLYYGVQTVSLFGGLSQT